MTIAGLNNGENGSMTDPPVPPVEYHPPYSLDFVAHLDAGCYPDEIAAELLAAVSRDEHGRRVLDALTITGLELRIAED